MNLQMQLQLNLPYSRRFLPARTLDLFLPDHPRANGRAILFIHGGGWAGGSKEQWHSTAIHFCALGYVCASAEYRLAPRSRFPAQIEDVRLAMAFLRGRARRWGFDPQRIAAFGSSSGGHLAAMLGTVDATDPLGVTRELKRRDTRPNAVVCYCPVTILRRDSRGHQVIPKACADFLGCRPAAHPALSRTASPLDRITGEEPPFFFAHGEADSTVPVHHSTDMAAALKARRVKTRLLILPGVEHGFGYGVLSDAQRASARAAARFLEDNL